LKRICASSWTVTKNHVDELINEGEYIEQHRIYLQDDSTMNWEGHERKR